MHIRAMRRPRYADVAATVALVLALGGTAYAAGTVGTSDLQDGAVTTAKLHYQAVTSSKIDPGAVSAGKLASAAVTSAKIAGSAVTTGKVEDLAVTAAKLAGGSVTHAKLAGSAVTGGNIADGSVSLADLKGIDETGTISFSLSAGSCGKLSFGVSGASAGQAALLTWTGSVPTHVVMGPLKVVSSTLVIGYACNLGASAVNVSSIGVRVVTFG